MTKPEDWAASIVHDEPIEHWRVTALLAKEALSLIEIVEFSVLRMKEGTFDEDYEKKLATKLSVVQRTIELTDYFLSGMREQSS